MAMATFTSFPHFPSILAKPSSLCSYRRLPFICISSSSSSTSKTLTPDRSAPRAIPLIIPGILRGPDGKPTLQSTSAAFLHSMTHAKSKPKLKKGNAKIERRKVSTGKDVKESVASSTPPKYSKAARRFYNEHIKVKSEKPQEGPQRLNKVLATAGVASRRSSDELIFQGKVTINGTVCTSPQTKVDISKDSIYVNGNRLPKRLPPKLYFAVNKPKGYICSCGEEPKSIISLFDEYLKGWHRKHQGIPKPRLFTVGRLDVATTGLIVVTNDGEFAQRLSHPSSQLPKEYIATIHGSVHRRHLIAISEGTIIEGIKCVPDIVEVLPTQGDASRPRLKIVVHEGRNHEVRELVKNAGLELYSLKRLRIGRFRLPSDLGLGKFVELKDSDMKLLEGKS
ncbi:RNA pseudouridine synthase [Carex littledalei]|uniref:RNA pseudouridine synthase n=1 Tax=Carex littledalei TaxID=544730 RepID=A0A833V850_9POAL|nr:RNA pseudouridine synthase [Carex littledalei]